MGEVVPPTLTAEEVNFLARLNDDDPIEPIFASHEALRAERDAWRARYESAWDDMRQAVAAGPEAELVVVRAERDRLRQALERLTRAVLAGENDG